MTSRQNSIANAMPTAVRVQATRKAPARAYRPGCGGVVERSRAVEVFDRAMVELGWSQEVPR